MNYIQPGDVYQPSNKVKIVPLITSTLIACVIVIFVARLYAILSVINPIIYLNFLILAGAVLISGIIAALASAFSASRNKIVTCLQIIIILLTAWYAHWAHIYNSELSSKEAGFISSFFSFSETFEFIGTWASKRNLSVGRFGSSGISLKGTMGLFYLIEFVVFLLPVYWLINSKSYYCEDCNTSFNNKTGFTENTVIFDTQFDALNKGDLLFLNDIQLYENFKYLPVDAANKPIVAELDYHYCPKCNNYGIVNVRKKTVKYNDKQNLETSDEDFIIEDIYINNDSMALLKNKLGIMAN